MVLSSVRKISDSTFDADRVLPESINNSAASSCVFDFNPPLKYRASLILFCASMIGSCCGLFMSAAPISPEVSGICAPGVAITVISGRVGSS